MKDKWNNSRKYGKRHNRFDVKLTDEELAEEQADSEDMDEENGPVMGM